MTKQAASEYYQLTRIEALHGGGRGVKYVLGMVPNQHYDAIFSAQFFDLAAHERRQLRRRRHDRVKRRPRAGLDERPEVRGPRPARRVQVEPLRRRRRVRLLLAVADHPDLGARRA